MGLVRAGDGMLAATMICVISYGVHRVSGRPPYHLLSADCLAHPSSHARSHPPSPHDAGIGLVTGLPRLLLHSPSLLKRPRSWHPVELTSQLTQQRCRLLVSKTSDDAVASGVKPGQPLGTATIGPLRHRPGHRTAALRPVCRRGRRYRTEKTGGLPPPPSRPASET